MSSFTRIDKAGEWAIFSQPSGLDICLLYNWISKNLSIPYHFKILDLETKKFKDVVDAGNLKLNFTKNAVFKTRAQAMKV